jgi:uncharacterized protein (TIGR00730 family)
MKRICVFCGSSSGHDPKYTALARRLGDALVAHDTGLVYGGASRGLMGVLASRVLERGGQVVGVIPGRVIGREVAHTGLTELVVVDTMHTRKAQMAARADAFIALPGGFGTLDELMEVITWRQLGLHQKPYGLLDAHGFFDGLRAFLEHAVREGFIRREQAETLRVDDDPSALVGRLLAEAVQP